MKKYCFSIFCSYLFCRIECPGRSTGIDKSPMDISYYPVNYPVLKIRDKVTEPLWQELSTAVPKKKEGLFLGDWCLMVMYGV